MKIKRSEETDLYITYTFDSKYDGELDEDLALGYVDEYIIELEAEDFILEDESQIWEKNGDRQKFIVKQIWTRAQKREENASY